MDDLTAVQWVRGTIRAEMARRGMSYARLAEALTLTGAPENERNLRNKVMRGTFSAAFFFQCMEAIGVNHLDLNALEVVPLVINARNRLRDEGMVDLGTQVFDPEFEDVHEVLNADEKARKGE